MDKIFQHGNYISKKAIKTQNSQCKEKILTINKINSKNKDFNN